MLSSEVECTEIKGETSPVVAGGTSDLADP
jgi:hypothetical protein